MGKAPTPFGTALKYEKKNLKIVGGNPNMRSDVIDKVTGRARYAADINLPGQLVGKVLRSKHAHARLISIDTSAAEKLPGVKAVVTRDDFPDMPILHAASGELMINFRDVTRGMMAREKVLYDGATHTSIAALGPEVAARTVVINGVSKAYAMTGWRIGYAAGPKELLNAMANIQSQSTSNPCSISQKAAVVALRDGDAFTKKMVTEFDRRRRVIVERLNAMPGVRCSMPSGAFYAFPNVSGLLGKRSPSGVLSTPTDLANYLLQEFKVAVVPGEPFGSTQHIRLSYATSMETILKGMDRLDAAFKQLT